LELKTKWRNPRVAGRTKLPKPPIAGNCNSKRCRQNIPSKKKQVEKEEERSGGSRPRSRPEGLDTKEHAPQRRENGGPQGKKGEPGEQNAFLGGKTNSIVGRRLKEEKGDDREECKNVWGTSGEQRQVPKEGKTKGGKGN